jgi:hypothetical protein
MAPVEEKSVNEKANDSETSAWSKKTSARLELIRRGIKSPAVLKMEAEERVRQSRYKALLRRRRKAVNTTKDTTAAESADGDGTSKYVAAPAKKLPRHPNGKFMSKTDAATAMAHEAKVVTTIKTPASDTTEEAKVDTTIKTPPSDTTDETASKKEYNMAEENEDDEEINDEEQDGSDFDDGDDESDFDDDDKDESDDDI